MIYRLLRQQELRSTAQGLFTTGELSWKMIAFILHYGSEDFTQ